MKIDHTPSSGNARRCETPMVSVLILQPNARGTSAEVSPS